MSTTPWDFCQANWQAFLNTMWILAPPSPLECLCTCAEPSREPPKLLPAPVQDIFVADEALAELQPLPALTDAVQGWLMSADPPIDVITFV